MYKIEVFGTGCHKCQQTAILIEEEIRKTGITGEVIHVHNLEKIIDRGVMLTPAVAVNGEIKLEGKIPSTEEIKSWFKQ